MMSITDIDFMSLEGGSLPVQGPVWYGLINEPARTDPRSPQAGSDGHSLGKISRCLLDVLIGLEMRSPFKADWQ